MKYKKIFVLCPFGLVTGGPDALHQMVFYMSQLGIDASIVYNDIKSPNKTIPINYQKYVDSYLLTKDIVDDSENALIVPETLAHYLNKYHNIQKYIWWLSVDNNTVSKKQKTKEVFRKVFSLKNFKRLYKVFTLKDYLKNKKYDFNDSEITHLCASYYAFDYVNKNVKNGNKVVLMIEPISKYFLDNPKTNSNKTNVVIYNPKKNGDYLRKIIAGCRDISFKPLIGYKQSELIDIYSTSKLYVDFGSFPGAERIPKEAVYYGCAIITGKKGASAFYNDVVINDEYKFDEKEELIPLIVEKISYILDNYDSVYHDFDAYRSTVNNLEKNFINKIREEFID